MRFKIDENLPQEVCDLFRSVNLDAVSVIDQQLQGAPDLKILQVCSAEQRVVVSLDTDFANLLTLREYKTSGAVVLRLERQDKLHTSQIIERLLPLFRTAEILGSIWIVSEDGVRVRRI